MTINRARVKRSNTHSLEVLLRIVKANGYLEFVCSEAPFETGVENSTVAI